MKFGIIGIGNHAQRRVMPAIVNTNHEITAVYSRSIDKAEKVGDSFKAKGYNDLDKFFNADFEVVYIASPNFLHYEQTKATLLHDKNVLLEKPMTLKNEHASELVEIAKDRKLALAVGFHMRFHPALEKIKNMIINREIGTVTYISGTWSWFSATMPADPDRIWWYENEKVGGGPVMGTGVHIIDSINYILGIVPDTVSSVRIPHGAVIEDTEYINLEYSNIIASVLASRKIKNPDNSLIVYGTEGTLIGKDILGTTGTGSLIILKHERSELSFNAGNLYETEVQDFVKLVKGEDSKIAQGEDGYIVVKIVNAAYESDLKGIRVNL